MAHTRIVQDTKSGKKEPNNSRKKSYPIRALIALSDISAQGGSLARSHHLTRPMYRTSPIIKCLVQWRRICALYVERIRKKEERKSNTCARNRQRKSERERERKGGHMNSFFTFVFIFLASSSFLSAFLFFFIFLHQNIFSL